MLNLRLMKNFRLVKKMKMVAKNHRVVVSGLGCNLCGLKTL